MIFRQLINLFKPSNSLWLVRRQPIISKLFTKKNEQEASQPLENKKIKKQQEIEKEDQEYNFFERRKEIDTSFDFAKLKQLNTELIPQDLGRGGIEEVVYWSQNAKTPQQIKEVLLAFNRVALADRNVLKKIQGSVHLEQFKQNVLGTVYLADSLLILGQYAFFGYKYNISKHQFWQKIEFKSIRIFPKTSEDISQIIDIAFIIGQFEFGHQIFNQVQKLLIEVQLTIEQCVKLYLVYSNLKIGEKKWIQKLLKNLTVNMHEANEEQLSSILPKIKQLKSNIYQKQLHDKICARSMQIIDNFSLAQILNLTEYLGFETENVQLWNKIQSRLVTLLKDRKMSSKTLEQLIHKVMVTYKLSTDFISKHIVAPLQTNHNQILQDLRPKTLSALSKGLYIYELQQVSKDIQIELGKLVIGKMTAGINQIQDQEIVKVIQDYNLTRNGNRQLYIFFEQLIKIKYLRHYQNNNRNIIERLIQIYENSGMCSNEMFTSLKNIILQ